MHEPAPALRAILLGASNLRISLPWIVDRVGRRAGGGPVEALVACGHGRSYGAWSRFLFARRLPGIAGCGLWRELGRRPPLPTFALVTDVGNDLAYGAGVAATAGWVEACLDRLAAPKAEVDAEIVMTLLPLARLERLSALQVRLAAALLFPGREAPLAGAARPGAGSRRAAAAAGPGARRPPRRARRGLVWARPHPPAPAPPPGDLEPDRLARGLARGQSGGSRHQGLPLLTSEGPRKPLWL